MKAAIAHERNKKISSSNDPIKNLVDGMFQKYLAGNKFEFKNNVLYYDGKPHTWNRLIKLGFHAKNPEPARGHLEQFVKFRERVVYGMLDMLCKGTQVWYAASGSSNLTSDLDVSLVGLEGRAKVMCKFYDHFTQIFTEQPGDVFDTNLYISFFTIITPEQKSLLEERKADGNFQCTKIEPFNDAERKISEELYVLSAKHERCSKEYIHMQRVYSFVDLIKFLSPLARTLIMTRVQDDRLRSDIGESLAFYRTMDESKRRLTQSERDELYIDYARNMVNDGIFTGPIDTRDREEYDKTIGMLSLLSTEGVSSSGALKVVVLEGQRKLLNLDITTDEYLDSAIVNVGNLIKTLAKHDSDTCESAMVLSSKYLARTFYALDKVGMFGSAIHEKYVIAEQVRSQVRGKINISEVKYLEAAVAIGDSLGEDYCDVDVLESRILNLLLATLDVYYGLFDTCSMKGIKKKHRNKVNFVRAVSGQEDRSIRARRGGVIVVPPPSPP